MLLVENVIIHTNAAQGVLSGQAVLVDGTRIAAIDDAATLKAAHPSAEIVDGGGRLLMPGLTNAHMHFYGMYARGIALTKPMNNFHEILQHLWWSLDKVLDLDAVYYSTLVPAISAVQHGVTSIIDHHASPNAVDGSLDRIEDALTEVGLRGLLCYEVSDRDGAAIRDAGLAENERYMRKTQAARKAGQDHAFAGMMGLHASFTVDDDTLTKAVGIARDFGAGCHIHMLEDFVDETLTQEKYGRGVVERLYEFGVLSDKSIAAHGIFLDDRGRGMLKETDTMVVHQAQSNMNNAVGRADIFALLEAGVTVGIGTDGMTADLRRDVMTGYLLHKHHMGDNNLGWGEYEQMALTNNYNIWNRLTGDSVGKLEVGKLADMILIDYYPPTAFSAENFWGHFLFGLVDAPVDTSIINGKIVMQDKVVLGVDEKAVAAQSRIVGDKVWKRFAELN